MREPATRCQHSIAPGIPTQAAGPCRQTMSKRKQEEEDSERVQTAILSTASSYSSITGARRRRFRVFRPNCRHRLARGQTSVGSAPPSRCSSLPPQPAYRPYSFPAARRLNGQMRWKGERSLCIPLRSKSQCPCGLFPLPAATTPC